MRDNYTQNHYMPDYALLRRQMEGLISSDPYYVPVMANASALLWEALGDINWAGFYVVRSGILVLGPFQGKTACIHIEKGRGVCGTAWDEDRTQMVPDVHAFPGHISCDSASLSEIVVPIHDREGTVRAVLDIDSPKKERFHEDDQKGLEDFAAVLEKHIIWENDNMG